MGRLKKPLRVSYLKTLDEGREDLIRELEKLYPRWGELPPRLVPGASSPVKRQPYEAVAAVARHPEILADALAGKYGGAEAGDFALVFKRYPDQAIQALNLYRGWQEEREAKRAAEQAAKTARNAATQSGAVRTFLSNVCCVVEVRVDAKGRSVPTSFKPANELTAADFVPDGRARPPETKAFDVTDLTSGEVLAIKACAVTAIAQETMKTKTGVKEDQFLLATVPGRWRLRPGIKYVRVTEMTDKEVAQFLTRPGLSVTPDSVKTERKRQSRPAAKGKL
jgi:hypothetical protein